MDQWLDDFKQTIEAAPARLLLISEGQSEQARAGDHWSSKQIIGHLIDSAANNHARFVMAQLKEDLLFAGYEQDGWVRVQQCQNGPWPRLGAVWRACCLQLVARVTRRS